ncbi:MAG: hypothetical protein ABSH44_16545 [Bryobacteraceae bacterium]
MTSDTAVSKSQMDEELRRTEERMGQVEHLLEDLRMEREELVRKGGIIRSARELFFPKGDAAKDAAAAQVPSPHPVATATAEANFADLSVRQAVTALLNEAGYKWTSVSEFEKELRKRGKVAAYKTIDTTLRTKLTDIVESRREKGKNLFRIKQ